MLACDSTPDLSARDSLPIAETPGGIDTDSNDDRGDTAQKGVYVSLAQMKELAGAQAHGAVYLKLHNNTDKQISVVSADTPIAESVELHTVNYNDGMMQMRQIDRVDVDAHKSFAFTPRSHHFMLMNVEPAPKAGSEFPLILQLADGSVVDATVKVSALR